MTDCFLEISSFVGVVSSASHYYGDLRCEGETEMVTFPLTQRQATDVNRTYWHEALARGVEMYQAGGHYGGFESEEDVVAWAVNQWRARFPKAERLILGCDACADPQPVIDERTWWPGVPARRGDG